MTLKHKRIVCLPGDGLPEIPLPFHALGVGAGTQQVGSFHHLSHALPDSIQIFWGVSGCGEFIYPGKSHILQPGWVATCFPAVPRSIRNTGTEPWSYYWFLFGGAGALDFLRSFGFPEDSHYVGPCPVNDFQELEFLLKRPTGYTRRRAVAAVAALLAQMGGEPERSVLSDFMELVHRKYGDPATSVSTLAEELNIHRTTLNRLFQKEVGISPGKYLANTRLQQALWMLQETNLPLKTIAAECGIESLSHFCRTIRRHTGQSPSACRSSNIE